MSLSDESMAVIAQFAAMSTEGVISRLCDEAGIQPADLLRSSPRFKALRQIAAYEAVCHGNTANEIAPHLRLHPQTVRDLVRKEKDRRGEA